jgi:polysaccharide export outer membrane protein
MQRYPTCFAVFLTILIHFQVSSGQSKTDQTKLRETTFASNPNSSRGVPVERRQISSHSLALALQSYQMGVKYGRAGLFRQAAQSFEKSLEYDPTYADAHYGLGSAYLTLGRLQEAIKHLELALKFNPQHPEAYKTLGEAYFKARTDPKPHLQGDSEAAGIEVSLAASTVSPPAGSSLAPLNNDLMNVYRVGPGDVLDVKLADTAATNSFTVTPNGLLEHPNLVEPLPVSGLTVEEIKTRLEEDLKRRAITDEPKVSVSIREYQSHAILVSGLVKEPGTKLLRREAIPLYVVVADAQPLPEAGRLTLIQNEGRKVLNIDLSEPAQMNILVRSGDVLTVQRNPVLFFYLGGEVKSPGEKPFRPGLTLTQAILIAEGLTSKGKEAQLAREKADGFLQVTRYKLKDINSGKLEDPLIQPGDRITIID